MTYFRSVQRVASQLLMAFSFIMLLPIVVNFIYSEDSYQAFLYAFIITFLVGFSGWITSRKHRPKLYIKEAFLMIVVAWILISGFGALPFYLLDFPQMSLIDAVFESTAGLTTTGATIMTHLDDLPHAVLFYRHLLQWFGGLGIILIAVTITPILGIGGMQLYRTEMLSANMSGNTLPRVRDMARILWLIYLIFTVVCALSYWLAGMSAFDAICHSFSTVSIGGFSTHDASFGYFTDRPAVLAVAMLFMLLSAMSFSLHFFVWRRRSLSMYWKNPEWKVFVSLIAVMISLTVIITAINGFEDEIMSSVFYAISMTTTSGFVAGSPSEWPVVVPMLLLFASFVGGCAGSTAGGMKAIRFWMLLKQGGREIGQLIHPNSIVPLKIGNKVLDNKTVQSVWGFFSAYIGSLILVTLALMLTGLDQESAFSAATATINNLGPGLGSVTENYTVVSTSAKWILSFSMLLGRLEIFALVIVLSPMFWRK